MNYKLTHQNRIANCSRKNKKLVRAQSSDHFRRMKLPRENSKYQTPQLTNLQIKNRFLVNSQIKDRIVVFHRRQINLNWRPIK